MSPGVREWLPPGAIDCAAVRRLAADAVGAWSPKWFARAEARPVAFAARPGAAGCCAPGWRVGHAVGTALSASETLGLAGLALGAEPERLVLSETDRDVIGRLAESMADDLAVAIEFALGLDPDAAAAAAPAADPFHGGGGLQFGVAGPGDRMLLQVAIPAASLVRFRKGAIPSAARRGAPLARMDRAFEATPVRVAAGLGKADLPLGALASLAAGDVIIFDRAIGDGALLSLGSPGRPFARGAIMPGDAAISLLLSSQ